MTQGTELSGLYSTLTFDLSELEKGTANAQSIVSRFARALEDQLQQVEKTIRNVGIGLSAAITAPFAGMTVVAGRGAASFESAMNDVHAALRGIDAETLEKLNQQALQLGPSVGRSAIEAAQGIQALGLAGLSASSILGGALDATLKLAAANDAELAPAAALVTDVMSQFGKTTSDLPAVVNEVTGSLDASKLGFVDFQQAIAQAGGVAGAAGVDFTEFATAIAGTAPAFGSGSDAGTSFKTFLSSLANPTTEATAVMKKLNLSFYDAQGQLKPLADIAGDLGKAFSGLSERSRQQAASILFGNDAMRTAIGLAKLGKDGFEALAGEIEHGDAGGKLAIQMQGAEQATNRLSSAAERLKIVLGDAGILAVFTAATDAVTGLVNAVSNIPQPILTAGLIMGGLAASIGPATLAILGLAKVALPILLVRMTGLSLTTKLLGFGISALVNPIGLVASAITSLVLRFTTAGSAAAVLAARFGAMFGVIGLLISGLSLLYYAMSRKVQASDAARLATEKATEADENAKAAAEQLKTATGQLRDELLAKARADRDAARDALRKAAADLAAAAAARDRAKADAEAQFQAAASRPGRGGDAALGVASAAKTGADAADREVGERIKATQHLINTVRTLNGAISAPPPGGTQNPDFDPDKKTHTRGPSAADREAKRQEELARADDDILRLKQQMTADVRESAQYEHDRIDREQAARSVDLDHQVEEKQITASAAAEIKLREAGMYELQHALVNRQLAAKLAQQQLDTTIAANDNQRDLLDAQQALARTAHERRDIEMRLLNLQMQEERARAEAVLASRDSSDAQKDIARARLAALPGIQAAQTEGIRRQNMDPLESYFDSINLNADQTREKLEQMAVDGMGNFLDYTSQATAGLFKMKGAAGALFNDLIAGLIKFQLQQAMGGGGILGGLTKLVGGALGLATGNPFAGSIASTNSSIAASAAAIKAPVGWASGGSGILGGIPGIDRNVLSLNGSPIARVSAGEMLSVSPHNDNGGGLRVEVVKGDLFDVIVRQQAFGVAAPLAAQAAGAGSSGAQVALARQRGRTIL